jgi:RHS repeat-associated protein
VGVREESGGLLDMRVRLYDPVLGRFTSPDPWPAYLPEPVTLNRYLYALGDPISQIDPFGLWCWTGKKHGKCRGLKDVVDRGREFLRDAAPVLTAVGTVASAAAVVAAGASVVCPPCIPVTGPVAVGLKLIGTTASVVPALAVGATCLGEGISFDCAVGLASRATMFPVRRLIDQVVPRYVLDKALAGPVATFSKRVAGLVLKGTTSAGKMLREGK